MMWNPRKQWILPFSAASSCRQCDLPRTRRDSCAASSFRKLMLRCPMLFLGQSLEGCRRLERARRTPIRCDGTVHRPAIQMLRHSRWRRRLVSSSQAHQSNRTNERRPGRPEPTGSLLSPSALRVRSRSLGRCRQLVQGQESQGSNSRQLDVVSAERVPAFR